MRLFDQQPTHVIALAFLWVGISCFGDQDKPVKSSGQGGPWPGIVQGVIGRVTASDDHPVSGAFIQPKSLDDPSLPIPEIAILSDNDGRYAWVLLPGTYEISVSAGGYLRAAKRVTVKAGQVTTLDFIVERVPM